MKGEILECGCVLCEKHIREETKIDKKDELKKGSLRKWGEDFMDATDDIFGYKKRGGK